MKVKDLMTTKVISVTPETKVEEVAELLHDHHFTGVPVVDYQKRVLGVIMERDFITAESQLYLPTYIQLLKDTDFVAHDEKKLSSNAKKIINATAADVMNPNIVVASPETSLEELAQLFATKRVNPIPVVSDENGKLVGVISRSDLIKLFSPKHITTFDRSRPLRLLDSNVSKVYKEVGREFAFVHKTRASIWLLISLAFFIIGFILGNAWIIDY